jgi:hypothetical protein
MKNKIIELFGQDIRATDIEWEKHIEKSYCPYSKSKCIKIRKSNSTIAIGTCTVDYGKSNPKNLIICPYRFLERNQVFLDSFHLLRLHEPGNELHIIPEIGIPGGNVDYFLVSVKKSKMVDFVGIEFQSIDTTGTIWPERQRLLTELGLNAPLEAAEANKSYGMNWKMTAKTILVQLHHKIETFEGLGKAFVLSLQDYFLDYLFNNFNFSHLAEPARIGDSMHFHAYQLIDNGSCFSIDLTKRMSTDANGIATALGLQADPNVELQELLNILESKISKQTILQIR